MTFDAILLAAAAALTAGLAAAQLSGPLCCNWPASGDELMLRMKTLGLRKPGFRRGLLGGALVMLLLGGGTLVAYAAAPAAPSTAQALPADLDRLSKEAAGVVGSGDRLSLQINPAAGEAARTIQIGDEYRNGWKLDAVTPTLATLSKAGETRQVGLNPTGMVASAQPAAVPSQVKVTGRLDEATIQRLVDLWVARSGPLADHFPGVSTSEAKRLAAYQMILQQEGDRRVAAGSLPFISWADTVALLGEDAIADRAEVGGRVNVALLAAENADLLARPITGPSTYYVPAGGSSPQIMADAGIDPRGVWTSGAVDAQGGRTMVRLAQSGTEMAAINQARGIDAGAIPARRPPPLPLPSGAAPGVPGGSQGSAAGPAAGM